MTRIGLTQRVEEVPSYGERRDCLDQRWCLLLDTLQMNPMPIPNTLSHPGAWATSNAIEGLILTGGNDLCHLPDASRPAPERDRTEVALLEWAAAHRIPVLGVCRGLQLINHYCGGRMTRIQRHTATRHPLQVAADDPLFGGYREVNSFHSWSIPSGGLGSALHVRASVEDGSVEAVSHEGLPWIGIMWHPEREEVLDDPDLNLIRHHFQ